jgi:hypothetical protein
MIKSTIAVNIEPIMDVIVHIDKGAGKLTKVAAWRKVLVIQQLCQKLLTECMFSKLIESFL